MTSLTEYSALDVSRFVPDVASRVPRTRIARRRPPAIEFADGNDQAAADRELLLQRFRDMRTAGGDDDGLERRFLGQALGTVGADNFGIGVAEPLQPGAASFASSSWRSIANTLLAMRLMTAAA